MKRLSCTSSAFGNGDHSLISQVLLLLMLVLASTFAFRLLERTYKTAIWIAGDSLYFLTFLISSITTAALIYHRTHKEKKSTATPLSAEGSTTLVARLAAQIEIDAPQVVVTTDCSDAHVTIKRGLPVIVIGQAMEWVARVQPHAVQALFAHELAHVANGDGLRGILVRRVVLWALFCTAIFVTGDVAVQLSIFGRSAWKYEGWSWFDEVQLYYLIERLIWPLGYLLCISLAYAAFLRMREFEADAIVVRLGLGQELKRALHQATLLQPRLLSLHPRREERIRALERDRETFRVESITIALLVMLFVFSAGLVYQSNESILALVALYLISLLGLFAMSLLGLDLGRKVFEDGDSLWERFKSSIFLAFSVFSGALIARVAQEVIEAYQVQVSFLMQLWETVVSSLEISISMVVAVLCAYLIGASAAHQPRTRRYIITLRLLTFIAVYFIHGISSVIVAIDPYGQSSEVVFWSVVRSFWELGQKMGVGKMPTYIPVTFSVAVNVLIASLVSMLGTVALASKWLRYMQEARGLASRIPRSLLSATALLGSISVIVLSCYVTYRLSDEYRMRDTLWLICQDHRPQPDVAGLTAFSQRLVEVTERRVNEVATAAPQLFIGRLDSSCNHANSARYPLWRSLLSIFTPIHDAYAKLDIHPGRVDLRYESKECGSRLIHSGQDGTLETLPGPLAQAHTPYRMLYKRLKETGTTASYEDDLKALMVGCRHEDRSWAHNLYGFQKMVSNPVLAQRHLEQALTMQPSNGTFNDNYALWLISQGQCSDAAPYIRAASVSGSPSKEVVLAYVRCLSVNGKANDALTFAWSVRRHIDESTLHATLGEASLWANKHALAREHFAAFADNLHADTYHCGRLFAALYKDITVCDTNRCEAPVELETAYEKWCWTNYAARYGPQPAVQ